MAQTPARYKHLQEHFYTSGYTHDQSNSEDSLNTILQTVYINKYVTDITACYKMKARAFI